MNYRKLFSILCIITLLSVFSFSIGLSESMLRGYSAQEGYQYIALGEFSQDISGLPSPILWRVLEVSDGEALLFSEYVLGSRGVHPDYEDYVSFNGEWLLTDMFDFLNTSFLNEAFNEDELLYFSEHPELGKLFLPSTEDIKNKDYGLGTDKQRQTTGTNYAIEKGLFKYRNGTSPYWTRDMSTTGYGATRCTKAAGNIGYIRCIVANLGWRPALYLDLSKIIIESGEGSLEDPFILSSSDTSQGKTQADSSEDTKKESLNSLFFDNESTALTEPDIPNSSTEPESEKKETSYLCQIGRSNQEENIDFESAREPDFFLKNKKDDFTRPSLYPKTPKVNEKGFLASSLEEYVYEDDDQGLWIYLSPTLHIEIQRIVDPTKPLIWYEADIRSDILSGEVFHHIANDPEKWNKARHVDAAQIAAENNIVFAMNSDYYTYRLARKIPVGIEIRDGNILSDTTVVAPRKTFPSLDTMAFYPDGRMEVYLSDELTAEEYLSQGAIDVISFGPILIKDGAYSQYVLENRFGHSKQPRCAIGMVEPGHYYAVLVEGRMHKVSTGENIAFLAERMMEGGCNTALNLDGGQTAVMLFMGKQISRIGSYNGGKTNSRSTTDILGIGSSINTHLWENGKK